MKHRLSKKETMASFQTPDQVSWQVKAAHSPASLAQTILRQQDRRGHCYLPSAFLLVRSKYQACDHWTMSRYWIKYRWPVLERTDERSSSSLVPTIFSEQSYILGATFDQEGKLLRECGLHRYIREVICPASPPIRRRRRAGSQYFGWHHSDYDR